MAKTPLHFRNVFAILHPQYYLFEIYRYTTRNNTMPLIGSNADFHPADKAYNPNLGRHRGRAKTYGPSPLSAQSTPETVSTSETPIIDRSNRPRLTIDTGSLPTLTELSSDLADTPHPSHENTSGSTDDTPGTYFPPQLPDTTDTPDPTPLVSPTEDDEPPADDSPVSPISPIAGPSTVGPRVRFTNTPHPRHNPPTPLQQHRETLRNLVRDFQSHILEPGEGQPDWTRFQGALQPAAQTLAANQILHALQHHLPSVQRSQAQMAQLRRALAETQRRQDEDREELKRLREENGGLRGALDRLETGGEDGPQVKDLTVEVEQMRIKLETAEQELQQSFEEREIDEGNAKLELTETEEELATLRREHEVVLTDRQFLRTQAQQTEESLRHAREEESEAHEQVASLATQIQQLHAAMANTTLQHSARERQVREAHGVVQDLREQVSNLQEELAKGTKRETSAEAGTAGDKEEEKGEKSPDSPVPETNTPGQTRHIFGQVSWPFSVIRRALQSSSSPADMTPTQPPPSSPLERARQELRINRPTVRSIVDPLEAGKYASNSIPRDFIHETTEAGLTGVQIVRAIKDHLPDIRDRQRIKGAYSRLQEKYKEQRQDLRESEEELASMTSVAENRRRQVEYWTARVTAMKKKEAEDKKKAEEEEGDEVEFHDAPETQPLPATHVVDAQLAAAMHHLTTAQAELHNERAQRPTNQDPNNAAQQTLAKLTEQNEALRRKLRECRAHGESLLKQYTALLATDENQTDKQRGSQRDVKRLAKELAECRLALEAAREEVRRVGGGAAGPSAEIVAASRTQLAEKDALIAELTTPLVDTEDRLADLRSRLTTTTTTSSDVNPQWPRDGAETSSVADGVDVFFFWLFFLLLCVLGCYFTWEVLFVVGGAVVLVGGFVLVGGWEEG